MANRTNLTPEKREKFLNHLRKMPNVSRAARLTAVDRRTYYEHREADEEFRKAWDEAIEDGVQHLEEIAFKRAEKSSDTLVIFLLKALRPEKYRETTRLEHTGKDGGGIEIVFRQVASADT